MNSQSARYFSRAQKVIPGGVNSPVRAFNAVGGDPLYVVKGHGPRITTADGRELIDFCGSWGPLILGHAREEVVEAVAKAARDGMTFGINTPREVEFAELLCSLVPVMDQVRLVNSGTEAVMTALRLARGFTGRRRIIKFDGGYHGHSDGLLVGAGSGLLTGGISSSAGVYVDEGDVFLPAYNDKQAVSDLIDAYGDEVAAIIVEPVAGNMGLVPPVDGFLEHLRAEADRCGALLIFDEVITGFRFGPTTYGEQVGITSDLTTLGKIIGGGMPLAALGGRKEVMQRLAPVGDVYQAGTLSGNPVAVAAGMKTVELLVEENPYDQISNVGKKLAESFQGLETNCVGAHNFYLSQLGGVFTPFFGRGPIRNLAEAKACDTKAHAAFFHAMLDRGFYLPPSQFECAFISAAHTDADIEAFISAVQDI
ncbi:glutamate-1-semialdehyde 2,1-aminomutase [Tichowtungia aerotolerans]|uniref:Glutamate-1-semialdehyde 2,1-aminomutase n=1 Tax=Tichowtungia aerotolerans TaxID=2697043 RepID=A0A6P1MF62_9BACT|nr:glutamate-1-semialdehyde 2,1-aminomutase [Tichowtungia aerotolerans]QHI70648.1 glutamate-1-semialdehyde 2,1-aminomutase [Tichowtungia aerotolerans]